VAARAELRQASVNRQEVLSRRSLVGGLAVVAYWVVEPLVAETLARIGLSGIADALAFVVGLLGIVAFVAIFVAYLRNDGLADLRLRAPGGLRIALIGLLLVVLAVPIVRFASTWGTPSAAPVVVPTPGPAGPGPTPTPVPTSAGETNQPPGSGPPAGSVTTANQAANTFGGAQNRWDNVGEMWILSKGKQTNLTVPEGWAATYVDNTGGSHGCSADSDWVDGPITDSVVAAVLIPAVDASC
jgi:hypothetical protein